MAKKSAAPVAVGAGLKPAPTQDSPPAEKDASPVDPVSTTGEGGVAASSEGAGKNPPAFPTYEVIAPLRHDGRRYAPGDLVALAPERAARLIGLRVVELIEA